MSTSADKRIGFIGGGNMAQAIIRGLLKAGHAPAKISVADPSAEQRAAISAVDAELEVNADNAALAAACDVLVLAVKPQIMAAVAESLSTQQRPAGQIIVSVAAGITLTAMQGWFSDAAPLIRVMPNQPALIGSGMSGLCATANVSAAEKALAGYVMEATGTAIWFDEESLLDAVTAVSGSGPAYFYLVMEIMQDIATEFGFDAPTARALAVQTALGAGRVAAASDEDLKVLRERVTSPGGTTAAALDSLEAAGIRDMFRTALKAARNRSIELGKS